MAYWGEQAYIDEVTFLMEGESNFARWSTGATLRRTLGYIHSQEWRRLLKVAPMLRVSAFGPVALSSTTVLNLNALAEGMNPPSVFHRLMSVTPAAGSAGGQLADVTDALMANGPTMEATGWAVVNDGLLATGYNANSITQSVNVQITTLPVYDANSIIFPEGHEFVLVYALAARLLAKGAVETEASQSMLQFAEDARTSLHDTYGNRTFSPRRMVAREMEDVLGETMGWGGMR